MTRPLLPRPASPGPVVPAVADLQLHPPRGGGRTLANWRVLAALAADDLCAARLLEAHLDATTIRHELGDLGHGSTGDPDRDPGPDRDLGAVWAAEAPGTAVSAAPGPDGVWRLDGRKPWCSGAGLATWALVTAQAPDGARLFAVDLRDPGVRPAPSDWAGVGMTGTDTRPVDLVDAPARPVGGPDAYLRRPGFWHGAIGVAAAWFGGAVGALRPLTRRVAERDDPHAEAHLGAADAALAAARAVLREAAGTVDAEPDEPPDVARRRALAARAVVETAVEAVLRATGRATGPGPLAHDGHHARHVADLEVYVRQSHAERDLAVLGRLAAADPLRP